MKVKVSVDPKCVELLKKIGMKELVGKDDWYYGNLDLTMGIPRFVDWRRYSEIGRCTLRGRIHLHTKLLLYEGENGVVYSSRLLRQGMKIVGRRKSAVFGLYSAPDRNLTRDPALTIRNGKRMVMIAPSVGPFVQEGDILRWTEVFTEVPARLATILVMRRLE